MNDFVLMFEYLFFTYSVFYKRNLTTYILFNKIYVISD